MRLAIVVGVLGLAATARADDHHFMAGIGAGMTDEAGWVARFAQTLDAGHTVDGEPIAGLRTGLDVWHVGDHAGFSLPAGFYLGGRAGDVRTTLGGGLGAFTLDHDGHMGNTTVGISPYASATLEVVAGRLIATFEARATRQVLADADDYTLWSVLVLVGARRN